MDQGRRAALVAALLALGACKERAAPAVQPPPVAVVDAKLVDADLVHAALKRRVEIAALRRELGSAAEAPLPEGDVAGLDFTRNAIVAYREVGMPFITPSKARPFALLPLEDNPYEVAALASGIGLSDGEPEATYRAPRYQPALERIARARYVLLVIGTQEQPYTLVDRVVAGSLAASCFLYEIDTKQLLGGFAFRAASTPDLKRRSDEQLMQDLETNVRTALWAHVKQRFPSAITPQP